jgi:hypothetical protein
MLMISDYLTGIRFQTEFLGNGKTIINKKLIFKNEKVVKLLINVEELKKKHPPY